MSVYHNNPWPLSTKSLPQVLHSLVKSLRSSPVATAAQKVTWDPYPKFNFQASDALKQDFLWGVSPPMPIPIHHYNNYLRPSVPSSDLVMSLSEKPAPLPLAFATPSFQAV